MADNNPELEVDVPAAAEPKVEEPTPAAAPTASVADSRRLRSQHSSGMETSILRFKNVNFVVGKADSPRYLLTDVSGTVKWGQVLAIMGPSGAGKTTLISTLTLDAYYGKAIGKITLNGVPMDDTVFRHHCYVVKQHDKHWPYLTLRETLRYAAELYEVAAGEHLDAIVNEIIAKMGLDNCADTRNASLSGGQRRRLSIGIALLKQPTLLYLDEPTSGLDAAAASNIMQEIIRVAKEEHIIIVCTIHQPSTKVYNSFDQLMLMSRGRTAFKGDVNDAIPYFESIGFPCPPATNPAEYFLDLVNSDFSDEAAVSTILDTWEEKRPEAGSSHHKKGFDDEEGGQEGVVKIRRAPLHEEIIIMFRRHLSMVIRDPILYLGRSVIFLISCTIFGFVYWSARGPNQDQAVNKMWINIWFISVPSQMGVVAVYALNDEFKSILREAKNGMVTGVTYVLAKTILVLPIMIIFALFSLGIPAFVIQNIPGTAFGGLLVLFACLMFVFESVAECIAVWVDDPILGMLQFMNFWFASFLFGGFLLPLRDLYWPFELFYYVMPYAYYVRSSTRIIYKESTWDACHPGQSYSAVCLPTTNGLIILEGVSKSFPLLTAKDYFAHDTLIIVAIGLFYKILYIIGALYKTSQSAKIHEK